MLNCCVTVFSSFFSDSFPASLDPLASSKTTGWTRLICPTGSTSSGPRAWPPSSYLIWEGFSSQVCSSSTMLKWHSRSAFIFKCIFRSSGLTLSFHTSWSQSWNPSAPSVSSVHVRWSWSPRKQWQQRRQVERDL